MCNVIIFKKENGSKHRAYFNGVEQGLVAELDRTRRVDTRGPIVAELIKLHNVTLNDVAFPGDISRENVRNAI